MNEVTVAYERQRDHCAREVARAVADGVKPSLLDIAGFVAAEDALAAAVVGA